MSILIGDGRFFAIRFELDSEYGGPWLFGRLCYIIDGFEFGVYTLGTSLRDALVQSSYISSYSGVRENCNLFFIDDEVLFNDLCSGIFAGENMLGIADPIRYSVVIPIDVFSGCRAFVISCDKKEKLIFKDSKSEIVRSIIMEVGFFDEVFNGFLDAIEDMLSRELSGQL